MAFIDKLTELAKVVTDQAAELARSATEIGGELAKNVADKTGELLEIGKLNGQISSTNTSINELKIRLGEYYWNLYTQGEQLDEDAVVLCTTIQEYTEEIAKLKAQLNELKTKHEAAAGQVCQACGTVNHLDACFCKNCGVKLEIVEAEAEESECSCCCGHHEGEEHECCCGHHEGEEHECCCGHHEGEEHECCCGHHEGEEHECCCGHHEGEEHECCCGHHEGEEHECCCGHCAEESDEEETVIEIATTKVCPNCQAENDAEHTFCNKCGAKL